MDFLKNYHNPCSLYIGKNWLWLRVHKTGGTSMYEVLKNDCLNVAKGQESAAKKWIKETETLKDYFVWAFVRNPYDRFNSAAAYFKINPNVLALNFDSMRKNDVIKRHTEKQYLFTHHDGELMANEVKRFENLESDFKDICEKIKVKLVKLPLLNKSKHGSWKNELTKFTIDFINEYYKKDFEYFGYDKHSNSTVR